MSGPVLSTEDEMVSKGNTICALEEFGACPWHLPGIVTLYRVKQRAYLATSLLYVSKETGKRCVVVLFLKGIFQMILYISTGK